MLNQVCPNKLWRFLQRGGLGLLLGACLGPTSVWSQNELQGLPAAPAAPVATSPAPDVETVARRERLEQALDKIREAFARGDYRAVLTAVEVAELIEPGNPSVRLYREWAREKLAQAQIGTEADVLNREAGTTPSVAPVSPIMRSVTPVPSPVAPLTPTPVGSSEGVRAGDRSFVAQTNLLNSPWLLGGAGVILLAVIGGVVVLLRKRLARESEVEPSESVEESQGTLEPEPTRELAPEVEAPSLGQPGKSEPAAWGLGTGLSLGTPSPLGGTSLSFPQPEGLFSTGVTPEAQAQSQPKPTMPQGPEVPEVPEDEEFSMPLGGGPQPEEKPQPAGVPSVVSFEDLGISLPTEEPEAPLPTSEAKAGTAASSGYQTSFEDSRIVIRPVSESGASAPSPQESDKGSIELPLESDETEYAPQVPPRPLAEGPVIQLEDILGEKPAGLSADVQAKEAEAETFSELPTIELPSAAPQSAPAEELPEPERPSASSEQGISFSAIADGELDELSVMPAKPAEKPTEETYHAQEPKPAPLTPTTGQQVAPSVPPTSIELDEALGETKAIPTPLSDENLEETRTLPSVGGAAAEPSSPQPSEPSSYVVVSPGGAKDAQADDYTEKIFREQFERGIRAMEEGNYKQAVHFLSIAAAINPEHEEVRAKLREAREAKRRQEQGGGKQ
ncbi:MAG: hypothetical protein KatS3mg130_2182 [Candidatus Sumerlaea sp.]|nr:MAG: hypothetical protein KatS3mg130_2182 [Candidatus Sumerlaea sp.]